MNFVNIDGGDDEIYVSALVTFELNVVVVLGHDSPRRRSSSIGI